MLKFCGQLFLVASIILASTFAYALPVDLGTFTTIAASDPVVISDGTVTIHEDLSLAAIYFFNDNFLVGADASIFSFDYDLQYGPEDESDYFLFELNFVEALGVSEPEDGHFEIDLSPYRNEAISLSWGLFWDGDAAAGAMLEVSNVDLSVAGTPVPEPTTIVLLGCGILCAAGLCKKKFR